MLHVGHNNVVSKDKVVAITKAEAAPVKRLIAAYKSENKCIDATEGRKTRSVVYTTDYIILSGMHSRSLEERFRTGDRSTMEVEDK